MGFKLCFILSLCIYNYIYVYLLYVVVVVVLATVFGVDGGNMWKPPERSKLVPTNQKDT